MAAPVNQAFYGARESARTALAGNVGGLERRQEVHTPDWVWELAERVFGGQVGYDPCAASNPAHWRAAVNVTLPPAAVELERFLPEATKEQERALVRALKPFYRALPGFGGLVSSYVNFPYKFSEDWLDWLARRGETGAPAIALFPIRCRRPWWVKAVRTATECVALNKIRFVGYKQDFTECMCLSAWNCTIPSLGSLETSRPRW